MDVIEHQDPPLLPGRAGWSLPDLVVKNAVSLYGVHIGRKLIPLASIPYLARVLGPEGWGQVVFVIAMGELIAILIESGFPPRPHAQSRVIAMTHSKRENHHRRLVCQAMLAASAISVSFIAARFIPCCASTRCCWRAV